MTTHSPSNQFEPAFEVESASIPIVTASVLLEDIKNRLKRGERVVSYFASRADDTSHVHLNCAFHSKESGLILLRGVHTKHDPLPSLTTEFPLFHCFEREMSEEWEVRFLHHPWMKPIRFSGKHQNMMGDYPFFRLEGKEIHEVGVGPIHAGVIEPGHFRFMCYGETVHHLEIQLGYQHRGVQTLILNRPGPKLSPLVETISGDSTIAHTWAYCAAWEKLSGKSMPLSVQIVRGIGL